MVNVLQAFVPRQVSNLPKPSLWRVDAGMPSAGIGTVTAASTSSRGYLLRPSACTPLGSAPPGSPLYCIPRSNMQTVA
jgi:hypothetical protein